jgi:hypothetical protein
MTKQQREYLEVLKLQAEERNHAKNMDRGVNRREATDVIDRELKNQNLDKRERAEQERIRKNEYYTQLQEQQKQNKLIGNARPQGHLDQDRQEGSPMGYAQHQGFEAYEDNDGREQYNEEFEARLRHQMAMEEMERDAGYQGRGGPGYQDQPVQNLTPGPSQPRVQRNFIPNNLLAPDSSNQGQPMGYRAHQEIGHNYQGIQRPSKIPTINQGTSQEAYKDIKKKYGNHSTQYNILTGK